MGSGTSRDPLSDTIPLRHTLTQQIPLFLSIPQYYSNFQPHIREFQAWSQLLQVYWWFRWDVVVFVLWMMLRLCPTSLSHPLLPVIPLSDMRELLAIYIFLLRLLCSIAITLLTLRRGPVDFNKNPSRIDLRTPDVPFGVSLHVGIDRGPSFQLTQ